MRYFHFTDFPFRNKFQTSSITVTKEHFSIYQSGNTSKQKKW